MILDVFLTFCYVFSTSFLIYQSIVRREVSILTSSIDVASRGSERKQKAGRFFLPLVNITG